ncbi:orotate phosphoribosyltransferase [Patescibacteria group bacterium]
MHIENYKEQLILDLHTIEAIKFGEFKLKSGLLSPYYLDLRMLVSYPYLLELTAEVFWETLRVLSFDIVVGVPYTAIPIATAISLKHNQTTVFVRKEAKDYGTKRLLEGAFHPGQIAIVVDDVISDGKSKIETITPLKEAGLTVNDIVVLLDRDQGGVELIKRHGYNCHSIFNVNQIFETLLKYKRVTKDMVEKSQKFNKESRKKFLGKKR